MSVSKKLLLVLCGLLYGCENSDNAVEPAQNTGAEKKYFVSATSGENTSREVLQLLASGLGQSEITALLKYDVESYAVTYRTTYKGAELHASGLIMLPRNMPGEAPIVSLQHGTTFRKSEAPSENSGLQGMEFFAAAGYVTLVPDYIGYGKSESVFHPYYDKTHSASAVIDFVKAAKEFLDSKKISFNDKLFLAGYSEGGYVTLAAAKEIEQDDSHDLEVTAVAAGAGGYDLVAMNGSITSATYYSYPSYLAFVLMSYNHTYDWNKPLAYFFRENYADSLVKYLNGSHGGGFIDSKLTNHVPSLLNEEFFKALKGDGESAFKDALSRNGVAGWNTRIPIRLFHGTKDDVIPLENSEITLANFKAAGSDQVTLTLIPEGTHGNSFVPMLHDFIPWFLSF